MKKYLAQLRPLERRLAVAVLVILIIVLNWAFVWPHFSDLDNLRRRGDTARQKLELYRKTVVDSSNYESLIKQFENQGQSVAPEDQSVNMLQMIQTQSQLSGVGIINSSPQMTRTNQFFTEQTQNLNVIATDEQLVDFLYKLGNDASMVRVLDLELQPDASRQHLNANIRLVASYQKKVPNLKSTTAKAK